MPRQHWTSERVLSDIQAEAAAGEDLSYMATLRRSLPLLRAAERYFGRWSEAIKAAGIEYTEIRKLRLWTREAVVARIQEWHAQGADLSFCHVADTLDPPLAAAALHADRFACWEDALEAAGLDPDQVCRARRWTPERIAQELFALAQQGVPLTQPSLAKVAPRLLTAIHRHTGSVVEARQALGLNAQGNGRTERPKWNTETSTSRQVYRRSVLQALTGCSPVFTAIKPLPTVMEADRE